MSSNDPDLRDVDLSNLPDAQPRKGAPVAAAQDAADRDVSDLPAAEEAPRAGPPAEQRGSASQQRRGSWVASLIVMAVLGLAALLAVREVHRFVLTSFRMHAAYGYVAVALIALLALLVFIVIVKEFRGYSRLGSFRELRESYGQLDGRSDDPRLNRRVRREIEAFLRYLDKTARGELRVKIERLRERMNVADDACEWKEDIERILLDPLDKQAQEAIKEEAMRVAVGTAVSPYGFVDATISLWRNMRLVRRIAGVYRVRPGAWGTLLIIRRILAAVALGELAQEAFNALLAAGVPKHVFGAVGLVSPVAQGAANAVMTIRVGLLAQRECRPLLLPQEKQRGILSMLAEAVGCGIKSAARRFLKPSRSEEDGVDATSDE